MTTSRPRHNKAVPRAIGGVAEWLKAAVLKTAGSLWARGFESLRLRRVGRNDGLAYVVSNTRSRDRVAEGA